MSPADEKQRFPGNKATSHNGTLSSAGYRNRSRSLVGDVPGSFVPDFACELVDHQLSRNRYMHLMFCRLSKRTEREMSENIGSALERAYRLFGDREAVIDGGLRWSYRELRHRVAAFDASLDTLGLATGDVVAVLALNFGRAPGQLAGDPEVGQSAQRSERASGACGARVHRQRFRSPGAGRRRRVPRARPQAR